MHHKLTIGDYESALLSIWRDLLNIEEIDLDDNFFETEGNSLLALRLISLINAELKVRVSLRDIFVNPTITTQACLIFSQQNAESTQSFIAVSRPERIPLSFSQERLWFIDQFEGSLQYHIPMVYSLNGKADINRLQRSFDEIIKRHEVLHTVILQDNGIPFQKTLDIYHSNINVIHKNDQDDIDDLIQNLISLPFDLAADLMIRMNLLQNAGGSHILVIVAHHIAFDGWSVSIFISELMKLYGAMNAREIPNMKPLDIQYADYALWQFQHITSSIGDQKIGYWQNKLSETTPIALPTDFARPSIVKPQGAVVSFDLDAKVTKQLKEISKQHNVTLFTTLLSAFTVFLYHYTNQEDITIGVPVSNRPHKDFEGLIGMFVNTIVLRNKIDENQSFTDLLKQIKETTLEAYEHGNVPLEKIVEAVSKERDLSRTPLFQVMFSFNNTPTVELKLDNEYLQPYPLKSLHSQFELTLSVRELKEGLHCSFQYNTTLFSEETIRRMKGHFIELIHSIINNQQLQLHSFELINKEEKHTLTRIFNNTAYPYSKTDRLTTMFIKQCLSAPDAIALIVGDRSFTYDHINKRSNQLARFLIRQSVEPGMLVPVLLERDLNLIVAVLAILKCGAAYVPIDTTYPDERINTILTDINAKILVSSTKIKTIVTEEEINTLLIDAIEEQILKEETTPLNDTCVNADTAYIIYTSGSTGKPKGVIIKHNQVINYIMGLNAHVNFSGRKIYSLTTVSFDIFVMESLQPLCTGGTIILGSEEDQRDPVSAIRGVLKHKPDIFNCTPSRMKFLLDSGDKKFLCSFSEILLGGEPFTADLFNELRKEFKGRIFNLYGPTETTVYATIKEIRNTEEINVGRPLYNTRVYILNNKSSLKPLGVYGEICIAGDGVSEGYLGLDKLTSEKFLFNKHLQNERMYHTGDNGRWLPNGELEVTGRNDDQLKIRGFRIEPGEITSTIMKSGLVKRAYITSIKDHDGNNTIVCYLIENPAYKRQLLINYLKRHLPDYMVPLLWVEVDELPLTINGKVNKKLLPPPGRVSTTTTDFKLPETPTEGVLKEIWEEILGRKEISTNDSFFAIGGHSLFAVRVTTAIKRKMNISVPVNMIFQLPTISSLGESIDVLAFNKEEKQNYKVFKI